MRDFLITLPDLSSTRVSDDPPFSYVGLDVFSKDKSGQSESKVYICLFTFASTRGINLELTQGLDVHG